MEQTKEDNAPRRTESSHGIFEHSVCVQCIFCSVSDLCKGAQLFRSLTPCHSNCDCDYDWNPQTMLNSQIKFQIVLNCLHRVNTNLWLLRIGDFRICFSFRLRNLIVVEWLCCGFRVHLQTNKRQAKNKEVRAHWLTKTERHRERKKVSNFIMSW